MTLQQLAEEIRTYMEQNKMRAGSVHAMAVLRTLYKLGYEIHGTTVKRTK